GTQADHRLSIGTDLIRKRETRSERVGIVAIEAAIAGGFIDYRAGQIIHERVWFFEVGALHAAVLLFKQCDEVVTETVFQRQLARDLPTVLNVSREGMVT